MTEVANVTESIAEPIYCDASGDILKQKLSSVGSSYTWTNTRDFDTDHICEKDKSDCKSFLLPVLSKYMYMDNL